MKNEWVDYRKLKEEAITFGLAQVAIWEECHIKQVAGTCFGETFISTCGKHGIYDENGEIGLEANEKVGKIYLD